MISRGAPAGLRLSSRPKYDSLVAAMAAQAATYRLQVLASLFTYSVWAVVSYHLWREVFSGHAQLGAYGWAEIRTYVLIAFALNTLTSSSNSIARIASVIRSGMIATVLLRPVDFLGAQYATSIGIALVEGPSGIAATAVLAAFTGISPPASLAAAAAFAFSVVLGFTLKFLIQYLLGLACFWLVDPVGVYWLEAAVVSFFSGALLPLDFLPGWVGSAAMFLPFQGIIHAPVRIYLGQVEGVAILGVLGLQLLWVAILYGAARACWMPSLRALEIQGG